MENCRSVIDCLDQANLMIMFRTLADALYYEKSGWSCNSINCDECIFNRKGKKCSQDKLLTFKDWVYFAVMDIDLATAIYELDENFISKMLERKYEIKDN